ncbi:hypothetical protein ACFS27_00260 [Promicromonospora vindobonensis]|uniref:Antitoxin protein of toxin-antitoxin system n=1 Tax=Promicromonospora vindobonensis TaxID=195748 RepID=A0ABW5VNS1_9MICO
MGLFDKAKEFASDPDNVAKAKEQMTDENVGAATDKLKEFAPDQADGAIDSMGDRAREWGGGAESAQEPAQQREAQPQAAERQASPQQEREGGRGEGREGREGREGGRGEGREGREGREGGGGEGRHAGRDNDGPGRHGGGGRD